MKFTKFIPLALALTMVAVPSYAATQGTLPEAQVYSITVPDYFNVTVDSHQLNSGTVTVGEDMGGLSWTETMGVTYKVVNNTHGKKFYVKASCPADGTPNAFASTITGTGANAQGTTKIAFANTQATSTPLSTAVTDALGTPSDPKNNKNVIAVQFNCSPATFEEENGNVVSRTMDSTGIKYEIDEGTYLFPYTMGTNALSNTFSSHDEKGLYQATLTITDVGAGS